MAFSGGTEVIDTDTESVWKGKYNTLAEIVGDKANLNTLVQTSLVEAINSLKNQVDDLAIGQFNLPNDTFLQAIGSPSGVVNILKATTSNKIAFGVPISDITIEGGSITSLSSPVPISAGGTGATTATSARSSLGLSIGVDVQAADPNLDQFAALVPDADSFIVGSGSAWITKTPSETRDLLQAQPFSSRLLQIAGFVPDTNSFITGLSGGNWAMVNQAGAQIALGLIPNTTIQTWSARLDQIAAATVSASIPFLFISSSTGTYVGANAADFRSRLGLTAFATATSIDDTNWAPSGGSPLAITHGGTGAITSTAARTNLGLGDMAVQNKNAVQITGGTLGATSSLDATVAIGLRFNEYVKVKNIDTSMVNLVGTNNSGNGILNCPGTEFNFQIQNTTWWKIGTDGIGSLFFPNSADVNKLGRSDKRILEAYIKNLKGVGDIDTEPTSPDSDLIVGPTTNTALVFRAVSNKWVIHSDGLFRPFVDSSYTIGNQTFHVNEVWANSIRTTGHDIVLRADISGGGVRIQPDSGGVDRVIFFNGGIIPSINDDYGLGSSSNQFSALWVKGIAKQDSDPFTIDSVTGSLSLRSNTAGGTGGQMLLDDTDKLSLSNIPVVTAGSIGSNAGSFVGYMQIKINGVTRKVPFYAQS